jgi:putative tryptophan/tyrosine transport system substrate-binding protein
VLGILSFLPPPTPEQIAASPVTKRLQELGWIEGKTLIIERANSAGANERLPELAASLVNKKADVIWALSPPAAVAAARATKSVPIVFVRVVAPLQLGLGASFARPGGNVTGVASTADFGVYGKRLEFLREILPGAKRIAAIEPGTAIYTKVDGGVLKPDREKPVSEARKLGFELSRHFVDKVEELDAAFTTIAASSAQALMVSSSPLIAREAKQIVAFANQGRLPSAFIESLFVEAGGLLSYGSDPLATVLQSLTQVDKILRGAKPQDMPIELPTRFDLVVNQKTARMLGLTLPQSIILRADRVVE